MLLCEYDIASALENTGKLYKPAMEMGSIIAYFAVFAATESSIFNTSVQAIFKSVFSMFLFLYMCTAHMLWKT